MRSHGEHWLCGPQRVCMAESHPLGPGPFITVTRTARSGESVLYSPSPLRVSLQPELLFSSVVRSLSPLFCFSAVFLSQQNFLLRFKGAQPFVPRSASSQICFSSSNHRAIRRDMEYPEVIHTEAVHQSCVLALQKECSREQDLKYLSLF